MSAVLPVGVSEAGLSAAVAAFSAALGRDAVLTSAADLLEYRDPYAYKGSDEFDASAVVTPTSAVEVQAVVRIANEHRVPLWVFGQGRNYTYGGPAPRLRGSVIVSLRRMDRVLEVSDELAYAVVEPGVRFFDLFDHLEAGGHRLWPSIPDLGWGSVVGNSLEYGRGYTPYGDHASSICGLEVVLPDGELLRTGTGAMAGNRTWHLYQHGFGPSPDGLFMQSNLGIVTRMGVWLMRRPEVYLSSWLRFPDDATVVPVMDTLRELMLDGVIRNFPLLGQGVGIGMDEGQAPPEGWGLRFALYGREAVVEAQLAAVREAFGRIPGVEVGGRAFRGDRTGATNHDDKVQGGVPGMELMDLFKPLGEATGHLDLSPVVPFTGEEVLRSIGLMRDLYDRHQLPFTSGVLILQRCVLNITTSFFDTNDEAATRHAYEAYTAMVDELTRAGYGVYRTNIQHMDHVAAQYDFNDHAMRRLQETLKDALDPNGILSPGKQGVWPRALRDSRGPS